MAPRRLGLWALLCAASGCAQCPDPFAPPGSPVTALHFPTGIALHPNAPLLFVASSNFDSTYSSGAVVAADLSWLHAYLALNDTLGDPVADPWQAAVRVPSFGGSLLATEDGAALLHLTSEDNRLIQLDVATGLDGPSLSCGGRMTDGLEDCSDNDHVLATGLTDPYGMALHREGDHTRVFLGMLRGGQVMAVDFFPLRSGAARLSIGWSRNLSDTLRGGSLALLPSVDGQPEYLFATGRDLPGDGSQLGTLRYFRIADEENAQVLAINLLEQAGTADTRGVAFRADGQRAYVISKIPASIIELDVSRRPNGLPGDTVTRVAPLGKEPSVVALFEPTASRDPAAPAPASPLVLVASFRDNVLFALDLDTLVPVGALRDVGAGPFNIAVDSARALAYVTCFQDDTVAVIGLPRHAGDTRLRVVARLGTPRDTGSTNPQLPGVLPELPILGGG
ncbi:MAG: hypothetical protein HY904_21335 [Deltaproteobacteria bacterium]|nr:hypothetical protein [Deltaproteobacteria bacterium]